MKKTLTFLMLMLCCIGYVFAKPVDTDLAKKVALNFLKSTEKVAAADLSMEDFTDITAKTPFHEFYVFSIRDGLGFILISGDDRALPILGYSLDNPFVSEGMPEHIRWWLGMYEEQLVNIREQNVGYNEEITSRWQNLLENSGLENSGSFVTPMLSTTWDQRPYYNAMCPADSSASYGRTLAGCVAVAMAQVMKYWNWPTTGQGSNSYTHSTYGTLSANFDIAYQWGNMPNRLLASSPDSLINAVAQLIYHVGVALNMNYGPEESESNAYPVAVWTTYFKYNSSTLQRLWKDSYSDSAWLAIIENEVNNGRPVMYFGSRPNGSRGHAFVCDGYNTSGQLHFNWGWGGGSDGYWTLGSLYPGFMMDFNYNCSIYIGVEPDTSATFYNIITHVNPNAGGTVTGSGSHPSGSTCTLTAYNTPEYGFDGWFRDTNLVSTNTPYSFTVTGNDDFNAAFAICNEMPHYDFLITPTTSWSTHTSSVPHPCYKKIYAVFNSLKFATYTFKTGCGDNASANFNTKLYLYSTSGVLIDSSISCEDNRSILSYTTTQRESFFLVVTGDNYATGNYTLAYKIDCVTAPYYDFDQPIYTNWRTHNYSDYGTCNGITYRFFLHDSATYLFGISCGNGTGAYYDSKLSLYDSNGTQLVDTDDDYTCNNGYLYLQYSPETTGYYYLKASRPNCTSSCSYTLGYRQCIDIPNYNYNETVGLNWLTRSSSTRGTCDGILYRFYLADNSTYIFKTGCGDRATADFNTELHLYDSNGFQVAYNDDGDTCSNGLSLIQYTPTTSGYYYLRVTGHDGATGSYTLAYVKTMNPPYYDYNIVISNTSITHNASTSGIYGGRLYRFYLYDEGSYTFKTGCVNGVSAGFDTELYLYDSNGTQVAYNDNDTCDNISSSIQYSPATSGYYYLRVTGHNGATGSYSLRHKKECLGIPDYHFSISPTTAWNTHSDSTANTCDQKRIYRVYLNADSRYSFKTGCGDGAHADFNTILELFDSNKYRITYSENGPCDNNSALIEYTATQTGYFFLVVRGSGMYSTGPYSLAYKRTLPYLITTNANPTNGGTITGGGAYAHASRCTLQAQPAPGYYFTNWTIGSRIVSFNPSYTFTVTSDSTVTANFVRRYTISASANPTDGGWVSGSGAWNEGDTRSLSAYPYGDYVFYNWTEGDSVVSSDPTYTFTASRDRTLTANFTHFHIITASAKPTNGGTVTGGGTYTTGSTCTLQATPASGYAFTNWTNGSTVLSTNATYSFTVTTDKVIKANFTPLSTCGISPSDIPYTDNFDHYTSSTTDKTGAEPPCWTLAHQYVTITDDYRPMIYYSSTNAYSGSYSLILNKRCIYAMPRFEGNVNTLLLQFYLAQSQTKYQLQVGVMTDLSNPNSFVRVATFDNPGTTPVLRTVDFSSYTGSGHYIAFKNILASGQTGDYSCNYIDDITLSLRPANSCDISVSDLPYTDNFDTYTSSTTAKTMTEPPCWTLAHQDVSMTDEYKPMVYFSSSNAHSGNYSLLLNKRGIYAMSYFDGDVSTLQLRFYVKQSAQKYQLQVGVLGSLNSPDSFTPVTTIDNGTTSPELVTIDFSNYTGSGHYIAFRNTLASGYSGDYSCNYIDDLVLELRPTTICGISASDLPYMDNFDSYTTSTTAKTMVEPTCWTLAHQDVTMTDEYKPMVYYKAANAHSGSYSLILNKRGIYAMPEFDGDVSSLQLSFYLLQTAAKYQLQVGVMSDLSNASTFVPVATINNTSTTSVLQTVDFSSYTGNGHYIAFKNILASGQTGDYSCNYIDDLVLSLRPTTTCTAIQVSDLPYTDNFDSYTTSTTAKTGVEPDCWTLAHQYATMTDEYKPMVYYAPSNAHSGSYSLILNKRGIYAMPEFDGNVNTLQLQFYLKQTQAKYQLQVGVMSDLSNASTFVPVATINNTSTTASVPVTVDFSSYTDTGHYIAFKNVLASGNSGDYSINYIDDLVLSPRPTTACGISASDLPYTDNFDSYTTSTTAKTGVEPDCWTLAHQYVTMTDEYKPMVYYAPSNAHSGNYSLILNKRGIYAMPEFDGNVNTLQLSMYVKQGLAKYQLVVGVMSDLDNASSFVPVATVNNTSTTASVPVTVDFSSYSGNGHYIAFKNVLASGNSGDYSINYIDDIRLETRCSIYPDELPFSDNFDSYTTSTTAKTMVEPTCWTLAHQDVVMTDEYKPMVYYASSNAHSGNYSLILNKRGIYAMPRYEGNVNALQLRFYVKQTAAKYLLQVGVMSDLSNPASFVTVATINNSSTTASVLNTVNFSSYTGSGHYIAFRNILASGYTGDYSLNYIDDLTLRLAESGSKSADDFADNAAQQHHLALYPNPTTGVVNVEADDEVLRVEVYDRTGRRVTTFERQSTIDLSRFATGIYTLRVILPERIEVRRVVKQ